MLTTKQIFHIPMFPFTLTDTVLDVSYGEVTNWNNLI